MRIADNITIERKLELLADAAKYDVACTSSGVQREGSKGHIGNSCASGICHSFSADGRCISLLKVLYTNECIYDCKYCINRASNDVIRTSFTPEELCELTIGFYRRNYIEGLFLSSGILNSPNYTMEQICKTLYMLRTKYMFNGYIHCKAIPGCDPSLIEMCGWYADRMSVNLELPTAEGLRMLAPNKTRKNILMPIRQIQNGIEESQNYLGMTGGNKGAYWYTKQRQQGNYSEYTGGGKFNLTAKKSLKQLEHNNNERQKREISDKLNNVSYYSTDILDIQSKAENKSEYLSMMNSKMDKRGFVSAGQSTQMIIGATPENDYQIVSVAEALYQKFDLKRVFYSAFIRLNNDSALPVIPGGPPLLREHRLYQADFLMRLYGFSAGELLTEKRPNFNVFLDPKCNWAIGNLDVFPVEVNQAEYFMLLRVPGIGPKSAKRIVNARKSTVLKFDDLKRMGVVLKRALYFITCAGKMLYPIRLEENYLVSQLSEAGSSVTKEILQAGMSYKQLSIFDLNPIQGNGIL